MAIFLIILSVLLWTAAGWMLWRRQLLAPALSYLALLVLSFAKRDGYPLLPVNNVMLISWLCITLVTMVITVLLPSRVAASRRGVGYIASGAFVGMIVGLLGFTFTPDASLRYSIMAIATIAGTFFGFLLFANTPGGRRDFAGSPGFFPYLLAKGFPAAVSVMQLGVALVLLIMYYSQPV